MSIYHYPEEEGYMPAFLAASIAADPAARDAFAKMTANQQDAVIRQACAVRCGEELARLVSSMHG